MVVSGPATLAMVSTYLGSPVTPDELAPSLYTPGREGSLAAEMIARARLRGFIPQQLQPELRALAQAHIGELDEKLRELQSMKAALEHLVHCCHGDDRPDCPILDDLAGAGLGATSPPVGMQQR